MDPSLIQSVNFSVTGSDIWHHHHCFLRPFLFGLCMALVFMDPRYATAAKWVHVGWPIVPDDSFDSEKAQRQPAWPRP